LLVVAISFGLLWVRRSGVVLFDWNWLVQRADYLSPQVIFRLCVALKIDSHSI